MIKEQKQSLDAAFYENNLNKGIKLPSRKKEIDRHDMIDYWPASIRDCINWFPFMNTIKYTSDKIEKKITLLPSLLNMFLMLHIRCWYIKGYDDLNKV